MKAGGKWKILKAGGKKINMKKITIKFTNRVEIQAKQT